MRTAIFMSGVLITRAIINDSLDILLDGNEWALIILLLMFLFMDVFEFLRKYFK